MMLLSLLATSVLLASPGDALFVHASALNLRARPKATASIQAVVPIGSACTVVAEAKDGWAELRCAQGRGFGKLDLLGPQPPDHSQLLAQGKEPERPLADALNLLQRAVTLKPDDTATREAFRDLFWRAEFDRLVRSRARKDTLAKETALPEGCEGTAACAKAALAPAPDVKVVWEELREQGPDVVSAQLFEDGLFLLRSGVVDAGKKRVTVQLESVMVPATPVLHALGVKDIQDACAPKEMGYDGGPDCGYYPDQSCGPDDCFSPMESCKEEAAVECSGCKRSCTSTCGDCRMKCGSSRNRQACVARCLEETRACEERCQAPATEAYASCDAEYATCSAAAKREWERTCEAPCNRVHACVESCQKRNPNPGLTECIDRCDNKLPESCHHQCLFGYQ